MTRSRHDPAAFTLIELLVVISIIALLVGILLPALASARASARNAKCLSNTRAIAVVMELYAQEDANGFYPTARMPMNAPFRTSWIHLTRPYIEALAVYQCPDDASDALSPVFLDPDSTDASVRITSYGINAYFTPNHPPYNGVTPWQIPSPSQTIIAAELVEPVRADHFMPMYWGDPPAVANGMMQSRQWDSAAQLPKTVMHTRHFDERANYVFTDGHAAAHVFADTWQQHAGAPPTVDWYDVRR